MWRLDILSLVPTPEEVERSKAPKVPVGALDGLEELFRKAERSRRRST